MIVDKGFSFDDVLLVPALSLLDSRSDVSLTTKVGPFALDIPIISSPMDTVTEAPMVHFMSSFGSTGILHRYNTIDEQTAMLGGIKILDKSTIVGAAVGVNGDAKDRALELSDHGVDYLVIDVAHGHMQSALDMCRWIHEDLGIPVMSGNIVTTGAAYDYLKAGATMLRVGVGPGSACSTRLVAGVGYPQISAIANISEYLAEIGYRDVTSIVSDGGIKHSGDVVKALAAGADAVILGGLLSPFTVSAGETLHVGDKTVKSFRGMASDAALSDRGTSGYLVEGESFTVEVRDDHADWMVGFLDGIRGGFAYLGAKDVQQLRRHAKFVEITTQGHKEGTPHF